MNIYFDFKFTGLHKNTTAISACFYVNEDTYIYCEFTDFEEHQLDSWTKENILKNLWVNEKSPKDDKRYVLGPKAYIRNALEAFLIKFDEVNLIGDCCHYDMVLFAELFGGAFGIPSNVGTVSHDINSDISNKLKISHKEAFDVDRLNLINDHKYTDKDKRNAYNYCKIIKEIYENI